MELVVDSNIIISALISTESSARYLIMAEKVSLFAPSLLIKEIKKYGHEILIKSSLPKSDFDLIELTLLSKIKVLNKEDLEPFISKAKECCPDINDSDFFALCLAKNLSLWSNDKKLKQQKVVKVISTEELVKEF